MSLERSRTSELTFFAVAPGPNKQLEVLVQGKQAKAVVEYLVKKGIPKHWIQTEDQTKGKK